MPMLMFTDPLAGYDILAEVDNVGTIELPAGRNNLGYDLSNDAEEVVLRDGNGNNYFASISDNLRLSKVYYVRDDAAGNISYKFILLVSGKKSEQQNVTSLGDTVCELVAGIGGTDNNAIYECSISQPQASYCFSVDNGNGGNSVNCAKGETNITFPAFVIYSYIGVVPAGASLPEFVQYEVGTKVFVSSPIPALTGYVFSGWTVVTPGVTVENGAFIMPGNAVEFVGAWSCAADYTEVTGVCVPTNQTEECDVSNGSGEIYSTDG